MTSGIAHCSLDGQLESFHCPQQTPAFGWYQQHSFYYLETTDQHSMHRQRCFNDVADNHNPCALVPVEIKNTREPSPGSSEQT